MIIICVIFYILLQQLQGYLVIYVNQNRSMILMIYLSNKYIGFVYR